MFTFRDYQHAAVEDARRCFARGDRKIVLVAPTGAGKCLRLGTGVLMFDGSRKRVEDVKPGDQLMGPDSQPRLVTSTCLGRGPLYRVTPVKGDPWVCNDAHILTLVHTQTGEMVDISVTDWINSSKSFKRLHKQFAVAVDWPARALPLPPYFMGVWLGDGTKRLAGVAVSKPDNEIYECLQEIAEDWGCTIRTDYSSGGCPTHHLVTPRGKENALLAALRDARRRLMEFATGSTQQRLEFLAGLIDTDGHLSNGTFDFLQKDAEIFDAAVFAARSVGLRVTTNEKVVNGEIYHRACVSGNTHIIPTRISRKRAAQRCQIKDALRTGIKVEPIGEGDYAGFTLTGDGRFLLGDFTVTHNTVIASMLAKLAVEKGNRVLFLAHRRELIKQCESKLIAFGVDNGVIMAGEDIQMDYEVQVASIDTLRARAMKTDRMPLPRADVVIIDECFPGDVEVLTERGFVRFDELAEERVAQVTEAGTVEFVLPSRKITKRYDGQMYRLEGKRHVGVSATASHDMVVFRDGAPSKVKMSDVTCNSNTSMASAAWGGTTESSTLSAQQRLMIALQADGSMRNVEHSCCRAFEFHFVKQAKIDRLFSLAGNSGAELREVAGSRGRRRFIVYGVAGATKRLWDHFGLAEMNCATARDIIEEMVRWDGHITGSGNYYFSSVDSEAADFYQAVCVVAGYHVTRTVQRDERSDSYRDVHRLFINRNRCGFGLQRVKKTAAAFSGEVYCVEVPSGMIVVRSRGQTVVTGNCHRSLAPTYMKLMEAYPKAAIIGLTATPVRGDGKGLGHVYDSMVQCPSVAELTRMGFLVPTRYFAPTIPDLTGVKVVRGDYDSRQLEAAMDQRKPVGDVIENWGRICPDRPTIVFASGVKHSIHLCEEFKKAGVKAVHIDGSMEAHERDHAINGLKDGTYQVVTNCMVLTEGFDMPELSCCILVRPTKNIGLYLQMAGRVLRPAPGKDDTIIIDHSGNVYEHGFVDDDHDWQLDEGAPLRKAEERKPEKKEAKQITCVKCAHIYSGQHICPNCGHVPMKRGEAIETRHAELYELRDKQPAKKEKFTKEQKQEWYSMLKHYAKEKGRSDGWVAHTYKAKFGVWPRGLEEFTTEPSIEVKGYIRHRNIAYAKHKEKQRERANA